MGRYENAARALGLRSTDDLLKLLADYRRIFDLPRLSTRGMSPEDIAPIVKASRGGSMRSNPVELSDAELDSIVRAIM